MELEVEVKHFKDEGRVHEPRNTGSLKKLETAEKYILP